MKCRFSVGPRCGKRPLPAEFATSPQRSSSATTFDAQVLQDTWSKAVCKRYRLQYSSRETCTSRSYEPEPALALTASGGTGSLEPQTCARTVGIQDQPRSV